MEAFVMHSTKKTSKNWLDKIGIASTSLCAIHCLMLPFLLPVLPLVGAGFLAQHAFEQVILVLTMILGTIALYSGYRRYHGQLMPFGLLYAGGVIYAGRHAFGETLEPLIVVAGGLLIVVAHVVNMKLCRTHHCDECRAKFA